MFIGSDSLSDLSTGSVFLATGGGGDPYVNLLLAERAIQTFGSVKLLDPQALRDDATVVTIGGLGAPSVGLELLPSAQSCIKALTAFEDLTGKKIDAVAAVEVGGGNSLIPVVAAASLKLPLVDGDGMGRAFPETQMMTYSIGGVSPTPAVIVDYEGNVSTLSSKSPYVYEKQARSLAMAMGGSVISVEHPMSGKQLKETVVPNTISFAIKLGNFLNRNNEDASTIFPRLQEVFENSIYGTVRHLYSGKVADLQTQTIQGYDVGSMTIDPFAGKEESLEITIKNEFLTARKGGQLLTCVPDLITLVEYDTCMPINAERIRYGQRVAVFGIGAPAYYRTERALMEVGPRCFGFDFDYVPLDATRALLQ